MSLKSLPVYAKLPSKPNAPLNTDTQIIPANQDDMDHPDDSNQEEQHILANQADMDDPDDHDQEEQHPVKNNNVVPETPSKFAAIGLERMALASPRNRPARARTMEDDEESYLHHAMRALDPETVMLREMSRRQEHSGIYTRRDRNVAERRHPPPLPINAGFNRFANSPHGW